MRCYLTGSAVFFILTEGQLVSWLASSLLRYEKKSFCFIIRLFFHVSIMRHHSVPQSLRAWFMIHFVADVVFAIPLFFAPVWFLSSLGFTVIDPVATRMVAAALVGIGTISLLVKNQTIEVFRALLSLKILWSATAIMGLSLSLAEGAPRSVWGLLIIFAGFCGLWSFYRVKIS